ncbi:hypothetical protein DFR70_103670 [Nocardia tenerifensis]|uniref:Uncharacterized protein n=1 Tax=Nocardia tenerifensis TaxID=228006 RepID=A0A318KAT7_9NOCA|nr:hypothetical protein [Nocardia tenerifensis]PXX66915.1 hypothetical protein DFR70_103670 [Nocardia tenerifensis]
MLSEVDAVGGWSFHENGTLTKRKFRRELAVWQDGTFYHFQVDSAARVLKMGRRSTLSAAKQAAEKAARPTEPA